MDRNVSHHTPFRFENRPSRAPLLLSYAPTCSHTGLVFHSPSGPDMRDHVAMTEASSLTGRLLVATPALADPNFDRAVVLLLDHDEEGSLGVVLNRPTPVDVGDILEGWAELAGEPGVVFQGGPVSLASALRVAGIHGGGAVVGGQPVVVFGGCPVSLSSALGVAFTPGGGAVDGTPLGWRRVHGAIG